MGDNFFAEDKLHEECGVFGIYSKKDDVALNTYWGCSPSSTEARKAPALPLLTAGTCTSKRAWAW